MSRYGPFKSASQLEASVRDTLQLWLHTYLGQTERDLDRPVYPAAGHMPRPRSWTRTTGDYATVHDRQIPRVVIQCPGPDEFLRDGDTISAWFPIGVAVIVRGREADETRALAQDYTATIRRLLLQQVPELVSHIELEDEGYDVLDSNRERTHAGGECVFTVLVEDITDPGEGPVTPDAPTQPPSAPPDYGEWTTVESTEVTVENVPLDEEIEP